MKITSSRRLADYFPIVKWARAYNRVILGDDLLAAFIVTIMLIPQSLAYALLAGLPAEIGLYASMLPLVAYTIFGTSSALAVGPVAVVSLMTAAAISNLNILEPSDIILAAGILAALSGIILVLMGFLKLGFLANFLSHPVISGFITASGIVIAISQLKHIFGITAAGHTLPQIVQSLMLNIQQFNGYTACIGIISIGFLLWMRLFVNSILLKIGIASNAVSFLTKLGPVLIIISTIIITKWLALDQQGVAVIGFVPSQLPQLGFPTITSGLWVELMASAFLISIIGFVESVSVAQTLAAKKRQHIDPNQELIGLGAANIASAASSGYPVTGGFARSVVNFDAGAATPAAGAFSALGIALATLFLTPWLFYLPKAVLAATIIVAVLSLVDFTILRKTWIYSKSDFGAVALTLFGTLAFGVEIGVLLGVASSLLLYLLKTATPHIAIVGQVADSEHFRNVNRHSVRTWSNLLSIRIDQSLYFANARALEDFITGSLSHNSEIEHVILQCTAINEIDASAIESLEAIIHKLDLMEVCFHLSEVKGPVMDRLKRIDFQSHLTGSIFLSHIDAIRKLANDKSQISTPFIDG
ncbi:sulfate permease [Alphaproteobacteria bacterium]|nr:sulfate permease [Alphaproteobacteria bacterium]